MENILSHAHKIILDTKSGTGNTIYLPLDKLAEAIRNSAPATPPAVSTPVPPPASGAAPSTAADASEDARDRERPQR
jgi:hypothetical protein